MSGVVFMDKVILREEKGGSAEIYLHGGHITGWRTPTGKDLMFLSKKAIFEPPKAIRGGVPICFPQFGMMGPIASQHGFARNMTFELESFLGHTASLVLRYDGKGFESFPFPFELRTVVTLKESTLIQELRVTNTGTETMPFTCALHTYYHVAAVDSVRVRGLKGVRYLDNLHDMKEEVQNTEDVTFMSELDRVYLGAPNMIEVADVASGRTFEIVKSDSFPDAVVWNPWRDKSIKMADFGDEEFKDMLCIEPAVASSGPFKLGPGETWVGSQTISYRHNKPERVSIDGAVL